MFHVEPAEHPSPEPPEAVALFGDRIELARRYHDVLATDGVVRGMIGPREVPRLWDRHLMNCAVVGELIDIGASVVDIGSGAGLPGIPLAIARPDLRVTLVEPLLRRTKFLAEFIESVGLDVRVVRGRAEQSDVVHEVGGADVVTSRAVAPLAKLAQWSIPLIREGGKMLALKGISANDEVSRDLTSLTRVGAGKLDIVECGSSFLSIPTIVVSAERVSRKQSRR